MSNVTDLTTRKKTVPAAHAKQFDTIHSLLLPLHRDIALLPNAAVAEVILSQHIDPVPDAPEWLLGMLSWRDRRVPLISFEVASNGEAGRMHKNCRIAVINTLNGNARLPYIAIITQGLPSLQVVRQDTIKFEEQSGENRQSVLGFVNLNGTIALIPDIDDLEQRVQRLQAS